MWATSPALQELAGGSAAAATVQVGGKHAGEERDLLRAGVAAVTTAVCIRVANSKDAVC